MMIALENAMRTVQRYEDAKRERLQRLVDALEDFMNESDSYLYKDCEPQFPGNRWYECRECGATAPLFTPCEHEEKCVTDALEKAWDAGRRDLRRIVDA